MKKLFGAALQEGDDDGSSDDKKNMQKTKQVAEKKISNESNSKSTRVYGRTKKREGRKKIADDSVVAVPAQNLEGESHDALDARGKEISNESNSKSTDDSAITRVDDRKKKRVADGDDHAVDAVLPLKKRLLRDDDSVLEALDTRVDDRKKKRVADDDDHHAVDAVLPLKKRLLRDDDSVTEALDTRVDDREKKRVADDDDHHTVDAVLPLKKRLLRDDNNVSEHESSDNENTQKMKQVADDSVEALDTRVDDRKKKRVADEDAAVDEVLPQKKRLRSSSQQQIQSSAAAVAVPVAPPLPKFHPRILELNGNKPPTFLFKRRVDAVGVTSQGNDPLNDRSYLASYAQIENELSERETSMLRLNLNHSPVRVLATDQKGVDYEFRLSWEGVSVTPWEWMRLRAENGLKERDTVEGSAYWVGGQFRLAISISRKR